MAKGDFVEVLVDAGGGSAREYVVEATRAGRTVEVRSSRTTVEVRELTRTGGVVRTARFVPSRVRHRHLDVHLRPLDPPWAGGWRHADEALSSTLRRARRRHAARRGDEPQVRARGLSAWGRQSRDRTADPGDPAGCGAPALASRVRRLRQLARWPVQRGA